MRGSLDSKRCWEAKNYTLRSAILLILEKRNGSRRDCPLHVSVLSCGRGQRQREQEFPFPLTSWGDLPADTCTSGTVLAFTSQAQPSQLWTSEMWYGAFYSNSEMILSWDNFSLNLSITAKSSCPPSLSIDFPVTTGILFVLKKIKKINVKWILERR